MKTRGMRNKIIVSGIIMAFVISGTGCTKKLQSETVATAAPVQESVDPMSFSFIDAKFRDYTFGINEYMREHSSETTQKSVSGKTVNGVAADCKYTISPDGKYGNHRIFRVCRSLLPFRNISASYLSPYIISAEYSCILSLPRPSRHSMRSSFAVSSRGILTRA